MRTARGEADPFAAELGLLPGRVFLAYRSGAATCSWVQLQWLQLIAKVQFMWGHDDD